MCEHLGKEPDPSRMPPSLSNLSEEVRVAFFLYEMLSDRWDGAVGYYMGKDLSPLGTLLDIYKVENRETVVMFLMKIQQVNSQLINEELTRKRKAAERKSK